MCIECSGIHRSLGVEYSYSVVSFFGQSFWLHRIVLLMLVLVSQVHVTKVRSVTLDAWDAELLSLMAALGNDKVNWVYEGSRQEVVEKPSPTCSRNQKDEYITLKYVQRAFLNKEVLLQAGELLERQEALWQAAADNDVEGMLRLLALGCDINWTNPEDCNRTALHRAAETDALLCVEMLIQNNALLDAKDDNGQTPLDVALANNSTKVAKRLKKKQQERKGL